jgi:hypothetical protein
MTAQSVPFRDGAVADQERPLMHEECTMWRLALIILLLVGSPALAGQASAVIQVGITITGSTAQTSAKASRQAVTNSPRGALKRPAPQPPQPPK